MRINHNIAALNTHRQLNTASTAQGKSMEKLASGLRINKAGDDAAGLAISEKMRGQIRGLDQASKNAQDGISLIATAEGALNETHDILQRARELAVQSANDTATDDDRKEMQKEVNQLLEEVDRISTQTEFNTQKLLNGSYTNKKIHIGANDNQTMDIQISNMASSQLGTSSTATATNTITGLDFSTNKADVTIGNTTFKLDKAYASIDELASDLNNAFQNSEGISVKVGSTTTKLDFSGTASFTVTAADGGGVGGATQFGGASTASAGTTNGVALDTLNTNTNPTNAGITSQTGAETAIKAFDNAIKTVSGERSKLGAYQNRLEHTINNLGTSSENLTAAESRIRDVDYALAA
jgi:flagellin